MKYLILLSVFISTTCWGQVPGDTLVVTSIDYTMTYGSGIRDTLVYFPSDTNLTFEKILMQYSMRCKDGKVSPPVAGQTNDGCGEWDYSCNTYIEDDSKADSVKHYTSSHNIANFSGSTFDYIPNALIDYHRKVYTHTDLNAVLSETAYTTGTYTADINHTFPLQHFDAKSQYIYTATELSAAGMTAGNIDGFFLFPINTISVDFCKIKLKHTNLSQMNPSDAVDTSGFTEVYFDELNAYAFPTGHRVLFHTPFVWDGVSNILIDFTYTNTTGNGGFTLPKIKGSNQNNIGAFASGAHYPIFHGSNYVTIDGYKGVGGTDARTVEAWIKTSTANNEIVSWGLNSTSQKWIMRVNGGGQLRTEVAGGYIIGSTILTDGQWHHVACVLDGSAVNNIKLYVDGALETISSSQNIAINTENVTSGDVTIGHGTNNTFFKGSIDNVRIWSAALNGADLSYWKNAKLSPSHPNYNQLQVNLSSDSLTNDLWVDQSSHARNASTTNGLWMERSYGEYLHDNFQIVNEKPLLDFIRGTYTVTTTLDSNWFTVYQEPNTVTFNNIIDHSGTTMSDEVLGDSSAFLWDVSLGYRYFDENGLFESSTTVSPWGSITPTDLLWWERNPMRHEIMSFVTPYGINLDLGIEGKTWTFDLTDFSPLLRGTKRMIMNKGGQWQEDMDIKFLFIVGTPPRDVISIDNIWKSDRSSTFANISADNVFYPRVFDPNPQASQFEIRSTITGHGQEGEFIPRTHVLFKDGNLVNNWNAWKTCGSNPIYPQGGTWIYDRAGWCPGMATDVERTKLNAVSGPLTLDYNISAATGDSRYIVSHQLVSYGVPNWGLDAEILDIYNPSKKIEYARKNPSCADPEIHVRNNGMTAVTSMQIEYGVNNGTHKALFNWTGNLSTLDEVDITLPTAAFNIWEDINRDSNNLFYAKIINVNGNVDDNEHNNYAQSFFDVPKIYPSGIAFRIRTNLAPLETKYTILDMSGNAVFSKTYSEANTTYFDTAYLAQGCYTLRIYDSGGDGFDFWANSDGVGSVRITNAAGGFLDNIDGDFGNFYEMKFTVDWPLSFASYEKIWDVNIYPNPAQNTLHVEGENLRYADIEIWDMLGRKIMQIPNKNSDIRDINVTSLPAGVYLLQARMEGRKLSKKFVIEK